MKSRSERGNGWPLPLGRPGRLAAGVGRAAGAAAPRAGARWGVVALTGSSPAKRPLLAEAGLGGRLITRRATCAASRSALSCGLETPRPASDGMPLAARGVERIT
ncbi:MAG: hypothetical protein KA387_06020 [Rubrivivax sp.]|nr:hypothetical protein [Rubrivivax sp.]